MLRGYVHRQYVQQYVVTIISLRLMCDFPSLDSVPGELMKRWQEARENNRKGTKNAKNAKNAENAEKDKEALPQRMMPAALKAKK